MLGQEQYISSEGCNSREQTQYRNPISYIPIDDTVFELKGPGVHPLCSVLLEGRLYWRNFAGNPSFCTTRAYFRAASRDCSSLQIYNKHEKTKPASKALRQEILDGSFMILSHVYQKGRSVDTFII